MTMRSFSHAALENRERDKANTNRVLHPSDAAGAGRPFASGGSELAARCHQSTLLTRDVEHTVVNFKTGTLALSGRMCWSSEWVIDSFSYSFAAASLAATSLKLMTDQIALR